MSLRLDEPMDRREAEQLNPLQLAYLGDVVWELIIRDHLIHGKLNVHHMHRDCIALVNAGAQAEAFRMILPALTEEETEIARRGRNAHAKHPAPNHQRPEDYAAATGFESLLGYLYLTRQEDRILELTRLITGGEPHG